MIDNRIEQPPVALPAGALHSLRTRPGLPTLPRRWAYPGPQAMAVAVTGVFFALYVLVSVRRHQRMLSAAYDLGIFEQGVRGYAHGSAPIAELKGPGFNLLGDHFHPVLALLAPVYRLFPTPLTLLVGQAALMALACLPLTRWAHRTAGPVAGLVVGGSVGASWGIAAAIGYDFHEICFAVPLLAFAAEALGRRRWRTAALLSLPLLLVKEDLGLTLAAIGAYIAWHGSRGTGGIRNSQGTHGTDNAPTPAERRRALRLGLAVIVLGVTGTVVETAVLLPAVSPHGTFDYWHQMTDGSGAGAPAGSALLLPLRLLWPPLKWLLLAMLAAPTACVGLRSPLVLLCVPTLAWRLLADNVHYWEPNYHYSAVLMPVLFAGLVDALGRRPHLLAPARLKRILGCCAAFAVLTTAIYPLHDLVLPSTYRTSAHVHTAHRLLARIPDGARVAASNRLAPLLVSRTTVSLVCQVPGPDAAAPPDWVVADRTDPTVHVPCASALTSRMLDAYRAVGYRTAADEDGILVLRSPALPQADE
ncbi:DUF2079 domain-containing protein [Kitasatospora sp. GP82]|uniref:DUF2079 domain-containing protein n=1 Tax=Kitasatospora sp. GP82 TaxID=3035089 RepID=UPI002472EA5D|nr:DUF2079 domain-containing protein [Kitasatospora sp. GP82]MDH6126380.1 putative membrane protein [Kitasatospora sp. GP82]